MKIDLSPSQVKTFLRCGQQWWYIYVEGRRQPPKLAMIQGKAFGSAVSTDARSKILSGESLPDEQLLDFTRDQFTVEYDDAKEVGIDEPDPDASKGEALDKTLNATLSYHKTIIPAIEPVAVENQLSYTIRHGDVSVVITGYTDIETEDAVIENKLRARKTPLHTDLIQLALYSIPKKEKSIHRVETVVTSKNVNIYNDRLELNDALTKAAVSRAVFVAEMITKGLFPPTGDPSVCTWCGFRKICPYSQAASEAE